jgi:hypothetical protein
MTLEIRRRPIREEEGKRSKREEGKSEGNGSV